MTVRPLFQACEQPPIRDLVADLDVTLWESLFQQISCFLDCPAVALVLTSEMGYQNIAMSVNPEIKANPGKVIPREVNIYCREVYESKQQLYVTDARGVAKWQDNPELTEAGLVSYLGLPILNSDGSVFATLCALDKKPTKYNVQQIELMGCIRDIIQREVQTAEALAKVRHQSYHDQLTGVLNRRGVIDKFNALRAKKCQHQNEFMLLYFDLDGLKKINDTWGHQIGDAYIQSFGRALHDSFRKGDIVGRLGGDEFVAMGCGVEASQVDDVIARIKARYQVECQSINAPCNGSFSVGSVYYSKPPLDIEAALEQADARMYEQKKRRREADDARET